MSAETSTQVVVSTQVRGPPTTTDTTTSWRRPYTVREPPTLPLHQYRFIKYSKRRYRQNG